MNQPASTSWVLRLQACATASGSKEVFSRSKKHTQVSRRILTQDGDCSGKQIPKRAAYPVTFDALEKSRLRRHAECQGCHTEARSLRRGCLQRAILSEVWLGVFHRYGQTSLLSHPEYFKWNSRNLPELIHGVKAFRPSERKEGQAVVDIVSLSISANHGTEFDFFTSGHSWNRWSWKLVIKAEVKEISVARGYLARPCLRKKKWKKKKNVNREEKRYFVMMALKQLNA